MPEGQSLAWCLSLCLSSSWHLEKVGMCRVALPGDPPCYHTRCGALTCCCPSPGPVDSAWQLVESVLGETGNAGIESLL